MPSRINTPGITGLPGDQLIFTLKLIKQKRGITIMSASAAVDGQVVAEAELMASFS